MQKTISMHLFLGLFFLFGNAKAKAQTQDFNLYQLSPQAYLDESTLMLAGIISYEGYVVQTPGSDMIGLVRGGGMGEDAFGEIKVLGDSPKEISFNAFKKDYNSGKIINSNPFFYYSKQMRNEFKTAQKKNLVKQKFFGEALEKLYQAQQEVKNLTKNDPRILKVDDSEGRLYMIFSYKFRSAGENNNGYLRIYDFFLGEFISEGVEFYNLYNAYNIDLGEDYIRVDIGYQTESGNHPSYFSLEDGSEVGFLGNLIFSSHTNDNYLSSSPVDNKQEEYVVPLSKDSFITGTNDDILILDRKSLNIKQQFKLTVTPKAESYLPSEQVDKISSVYPVTTTSGDPVYLIGTKNEDVFFLKEK